MVYCIYQGHIVNTKKLHKQIKYPSKMCKFHRPLRNVRRWPNSIFHHPRVCARRIRLQNHFGSTQQKTRANRANETRSTRKFCSDKKHFYYKWLEHMFTKREENVLKDRHIICDTGTMNAVVRWTILGVLAPWRYTFGKWFSACKDCLPDAAFLASHRSCINHALAPVHASAACMYFFCLLLNSV